MLRHLRLARARGSLNAPNSVVQDQALEILSALDEVETERDRTNRVKALLASSATRMESLPQLFPDYFEVDPFSEAVDADGEIDPDKVDESALDWSIPTPDTDDEIARWIAERESGVITAADLHD